MKAEEYSVESKEIGGQRIKITTYRIGDVYHCHVANADPGATIARADAGTREEAERIALAKTAARLIAQSRS
jgi:hypothetical protein